MAGAFLGGVGWSAKGEIERPGIMIAEEAITKSEEFVDDVFSSIEAAGHPLRRKSKMVYNLS